MNIAIIIIIINVDIIVIITVIIISLSSLPAFKQYRDIHNSTSTDFFCPAIIPTSSDSEHHYPKCESETVKINSSDRDLHLHSIFVIKIIIHIIVVSIVLTVGVLGNILVLIVIIITIIITIKIKIFIQYTHL